jgi:ribosomal protein S18 acetylase RimI-like enzyme
LLSFCHCPPGYFKAMTSIEALSNEVQIRTLEPTDLPRVVEIHMAAFPDSALTMLGAEAVRRYYAWLFTGPHQCFASGAMPGAELMGFCFAGVFNGALSGFLERNRAYLFKRLLRRPWLSANPIFRDRIALGFRTLRRFGGQSRNAINVPGNHTTESAPPFAILGIAVHPDSHGQGIGRALMFEAE